MASKIANGERKKFVRGELGADFRLSVAGIFGRVTGRLSDDPVAYTAFRRSVQLSVCHRTVTIGDPFQRKKKSPENSGPTKDTAETVIVKLMQKMTFHSRNRRSRSGFQR